MGLFITKVLIWIFIVCIGFAEIIVITGKLRYIKRTTEQQRIADALKYLELKRKRERAVLTLEEREFITMNVYNARSWEDIAHQVLAKILIAAVILYVIY